MSKASLSIPASVDTTTLQSKIHPLTCTRPFPNPSPRPAPGTNRVVEATSVSAEGRPEHPGLGGAVGVGGTLGRGRAVGVRGQLSGGGLQVGAQVQVLGTLETNQWKLLFG